MKRGRKGIKILGVTLLAALGLMAISVSAAQASGEFLVNGAKFTALESFAGTGAKGELLTEGGLKLNCTASTVTGMINHNDQVGKVDATVLFSGCSVLENKFCTVYPDAEESKAGHITAKVLGELGLHAEQHFVSLQALSGAFTTIFFVGAACTLPEEVEVTGKTALLLPTALVDSVNQKLTTVSLAEEKLLLGANSLFYGNEQAHLIEGEVKDLHLTGKEAGKTWGAK